MTRTSAPRRLIAATMWFALAVLVFGVPSPVKAGEDQGRGQSDEAARPEQQRSDHWTLGAGVAAMLRFQGSDEYKAQPVPIIDVQYGKFFAKTDEGIGVNVIETSTFTAGASINWMQGYGGDDVPTGIDEVDSALGARIFVSARFKGVVATLAATQAVTETDRGLIVNAGLAYPIRATKRLTVTPSLATSWANEKYMNGYFGVDASEAAASGFNRYEPTNGLKDVSFRVSVLYRLTDSISALSSVGVTHLLNEAADSPFVEQQTQPIALMGLTYTF